MLVTAGPTFEPIDPVRFIGNRSSGLQGYAIARAARRAGARVTLVSGPVALAKPEGVDVVQVESAQDMLAAVEAALPADVFVGAAAVADWRVDDAGGQKIKKTNAGPPTLTLVENPDILARVAHVERHEAASRYWVCRRDARGFASTRKEKLVRKNCDFIVANDVGGNGEVFGAADNQVHIVARDNVITWPRMSKDRVALRLVELIREKLDNSKVIEVKYRRLASGAGLPPPARHSEDAAGFDLVAAVPQDDPITLPPGGRAVVPTGFALELPSGFEGQIRPRSGLALKHGVTVLNAPGTVDADFRGEVGVILINLAIEPFVVERGARIAQLVVSRFEPARLQETSELSGTSRGERGFGSTGLTSRADLGEP